MPPVEYCTEMWWTMSHARVTANTVAFVNHERQRLPLAVAFASFDAGIPATSDSRRSWLSSCIYLGHGSLPRIGRSSKRLAHWIELLIILGIMRVTEQVFNAGDRNIIRG